jgi:hypothetical protein
MGQVKLRLGREKPIVNHTEFLRLVIAYTLTGALVCTVVMTVASLGGWFVFRDPRQQRMLFRVLLVQLAVVAVGWFGDLLEFSPAAAETRIGEKATTGATAELPVSPDPIEVEATPQSAQKSRCSIVVTSPQLRVEQNGGTRSVVLQCPEGYSPVGINPTTSFPARIDVVRREGTWTVTLLNLHGKRRPVGTATVALACSIDAEAPG